MVGETVLEFEDNLIVDGVTYRFVQLSIIHTDPEKLEIDTRYIITPRPSPEKLEAILQVAELKKRQAELEVEQTFAKAQELNHGRTKGQGTG